MPHRGTERPAVGLKNMLVRPSLPLLGPQWTGKNLLRPRTRSGSLAPAFGAAPLDYLVGYLVVEFRFAQEDADA